MYFPKLVLPQFCNTPIRISINSESVSEDGEPIKSIELNLKCNYQDKVATVLTEQQRIVKITGAAYLDGDIAPELATLSGGIATVLGVDRRVVDSRKSRNPDGTVNYTFLGLE